MAQASNAGESVVRLGALLDGHFELDRLLQLAGVRRTVDALQSPLQIGFLQPARPRWCRSSRRARASRPSAPDSATPSVSGVTHWPTRSPASSHRAADDVRDHLQDKLARRDEDARARGPRRREDIPFTSLSDAASWKR